MPLKKAVRTLQVMLPSLREARYSGHLCAIELFGLTYRKEAGAIRYFQTDHPTIVDVGTNRCLEQRQLRLFPWGHPQRRAFPTNSIGTSNYYADVDFRSETRRLGTQHAQRPSPHQATVTR